MNGTILFLPEEERVWFSSLNIIIETFFDTFAYIISSFFSLPSIIVWIFHNLFIHLSVNGYLNCFQFLAVTTKLMNVHEHLCISLHMEYAFISLGYKYLEVE